MNVNPKLRKAETLTPWCSVRRISHLLVLDFTKYNNQGRWVRVGGGWVL